MYETFFCINLMITTQKFVTKTYNIQKEKERKNIQHQQTKTTDKHNRKETVETQRYQKTKH